MTRTSKILTNPFLLTAEGFVAGAILFWATTPGSAGVADQPEAGAPAATAPVSAQQAYPSGR